MEQGETQPAITIEPIEVPGVAPAPEPELEPQPMPEREEEEVLAWQEEVWAETGGPC